MYPVLILFVILLVISEGYIFSSAIAEEKLKESVEPKYLYIVYERGYEDAEDIFDIIVCEELSYANSIFQYRLHEYKSYDDCYTYDEKNSSDLEAIFIVNYTDENNETRSGNFKLTLEKVELNKK
jgi:hypothetical protein